jgi:hypothetical protein
MKTFRLFVFVISQALLLVSLSGCDHRPKVVIEGGTAPRFNLTGHGKIQVITVSGPGLDLREPTAGQPQSMEPYWEIVPNGDYDVRNIEERGPLVYGQIPEGFKQNYPADGAAPQTLFENGLFTFQMRTAEGNSLGVRFTIHEGKARIEGS